MEKGIILIVDDTHSSALLLSAMLAAQGYDVRIVNSGKAALITAQATFPDLVLLDINMPDMDGYEVCKKLKDDPFTSEIPIVFISSFSEIWDKLHGFSVGGSDYITKPFEDAEVLARVESQLKIRRLQKKLEAQNAHVQAQNANLQREIRDRMATQDKFKQAISDLERLVNLDGLTEVASRRRFDEYLAVEWEDLGEEKKSLAMIMCDVDFFKNYNDTYGHYEGDKCLQKIAKALREFLKNSTTFTNALVARYGGEEFSIILPESTVTDAIQLAESLRVTIKDLQIPHASSAINPWVTLSLGVAGVIPYGSDPSVLITGADRALYDAKNMGRDRVSHIQIG